MDKGTQSSRRRFLNLSGGATAAVTLLTLLPRRALAALPHLSQSNDPVAKALQYVEDAAKAGAPHKAGQHCATCLHYQGKPGEAFGPCMIFPGFDVKATGWCVAYVVKS